MRVELDAGVDPSGSAGAFEEIERFEPVARPIVGIRRQQRVITTSSKNFGTEGSRSIRRAGSGETSACTWRSSSGRSAPQVAS